MGWVNEGVISNNITWQTYKPRFLILKGTEVMLFDSPPLNVSGLTKAAIAYKVYQTMFRVVKESETVDSRQHCFLLQSSGHEPRYLTVETRQELLRVENSWNAAIVTSVVKLGVSVAYQYFVSMIFHALCMFVAEKNICRFTSWQKWWTHLRLAIRFCTYRRSRGKRCVAV